MDTRTGKVISNAIFQTLPKEEKRFYKQLPQTTYVRPGAKVGRNDPCPCGSGKKFKKCCYFYK
jgi:uncharacterized protein YecA (UPF0149 family)